MGKQKTRTPKRRSPIHKAVTRIAPKVIPDKRGDILTKEMVAEAMQRLGDQPDEVVVACAHCGRPGASHLCYDNEFLCSDCLSLSY